MARFRGSSVRTQAYAQLPAKARLGATVRINKSGCLDQCEHGPTIIVYPRAVAYGFVKMEDVEEIVQTHLIGDVPVQRLVLPDECVNTSYCPHRGGTVQVDGL